MARRETLLERIMHKEKKMTRRQAERRSVHHVVTLIIQETLPSCVKLGTIFLHAQKAYFISKER
eukprot:3763687-Ditylum_brightwellii.AAC.1